MKKLQTQFLEKTSERTEENYYEMLGCVPPRAMASNAFLVGEPDDHNGENGAPRYALYFTENEKFYYGEKTTLKEFNTFLLPEENRPEYGKTYALTGKTGDKSIMNGNTWSESEITTNKN